MTNLTIIIPCYNESKSLPDLLLQIKTFEEKVKFIIIDNGSNDSTQNVLNNSKLPKNIFFKTKKNNTGYGAGIKFGFSFVKTKYIGWMHADLQQNINVLKNGINILKSQKFQIQKKNSVALKGHRSKRKIFDLFFTISLSLIISILYLKPCWDVAGQPNIFQLKDLKFINDAPDDHTFEFFIYLKFLTLGGKYLRFDAPFLERRHGKSSWDNGLKSKLNHSWNIFKFIIKLKLKL